MKFCFKHHYKTVTPSFMHLFVAKDHRESPASVPMFTGRECCHCGKRKLIRLQEKIPELIEERATLWATRKLEEIDHGEQLMWFAQWNQFLAIKDLENFLMEKIMQEHQDKQVRRFLVIPLEEDASTVRKVNALQRRSQFKLVVNHEPEAKHEAS